jgi:hypothetical protein
MLKKLFGGKKDDFYMQIDESQETETTETTAPVATSTESSTEVTAEAASTETATAAPAPVNVPAPEVPFWVSAMRSTATIQAETKPEMTFSTDYLLSSGSSSRRRPGPSLNPFKEIARQVKKPIN